MTTATLPIPTQTERRLRGAAGDVALGLGAVTAAGLLAAIIYAANKAFADAPQRAVQLVLVLFAAIAGGAAIAYLVARRTAARPGMLAAIVVAAVAVELLAVYFFRVGYFVRFPADILIWSESEFVNDILKFRIGHPLYTDPVHHESFIYPPATQLLTYLIASITGNPTSIPVYRAIQVGYALAAAVVALLCCRRLLALLAPERSASRTPAWAVLALPFLALVATNPVTNVFAHNLHNDSLAQLVSVTAFWLLLRYVARPSMTTIALMALAPVTGYFVKQTVAFWAVLYCGYFFCFDGSGGLKGGFRRAAAFGVAAFGLIGLALLACYAIWGPVYFYWTYTVLAKHGVDPLRSVQHVLDVWPYYVIGLFGAAMALRGRNDRRLWGLFAVWLVFIAAETYSSGAGWMLNHIGPGSLLAAIWFVAGLVMTWPTLFPAPTDATPSNAWLQTACVLPALLLLGSGLGVVQIPVVPLTDDARRYVAEIEQQFVGHDPATVLLDTGSWVYFNHGVVMKDRAVPLGDTAFSRVADFSGILERVRSRHYAKILVRNFDAPDFVYDHYFWDEPSGIRQALKDNYREVATIKRAAIQSALLSADITVLVPRDKSEPAASR